MINLGYFGKENSNHEHNYCVRHKNRWFCSAMNFNLADCFYQSSYIKSVLSLLDDLGIFYKEQEESRKKEKFNGEKDWIPG
jgi:hypothetical protein